MQFDFSKFWETVICILLSSMGGLARVLNTKSENLQIINVLSDVFVSAFTGLMVMYLAHTLNFKGDWIALLCGIGGMTGPKLLTVIAKPILQMINVDDKELKE